MSRTTDLKKLTRRVQRDNIAERVQGFGCDRTTISHILAIDKEVEGARITSSIHDRVMRRRIKSAVHDRVLVEQPVFCIACSAKYHKQVRTHSCECE